MKIHLNRPAADLLCELTCDNCKRDIQREKSSICDKGKHILCMSCEAGCLPCRKGE